MAGFGQEMAMDQGAPISPGPDSIDIENMSPEELKALLAELSQDPEANAELIEQIKNAIAVKQFGLGGV